MEKNAGTSLPSKACGSREAMALLSAFEAGDGLAGSALLDLLEEGGFAYIARLDSFVRKSRPETVEFSVTAFGELPEPETQWHGVEVAGLAGPIGDGVFMESWQSSHHKDTPRHRIHAARFVAFPGSIAPGL